MKDFPSLYRKDRRENQNKQHNGEQQRCLYGCTWLDHEENKCYIAIKYITKFIIKLVLISILFFFILNKFENKSFVF